MPITVNTAQPKKDRDAPPGASKWITWAIEGAIILMAVFIILVMRSGMYEPVVVTSRSMEPTFLVDDKVLVDHRSSLHGNWQRGDCILFETPPTWSGAEDTLTKRLIGLPSEKIEVRAGQVLINDKPLAESYRKEAPDPKDNYGPETLKSGEYFVMGDNRNNSDDSRHNGPINEENIEGRALWRLAPLGRMGRLPSPGY